MRYVDKFAFFLHQTTKQEKNISLRQCGQMVKACNLQAHENLIVAQLEERGTVSIIAADIPRSLVRILPMRYFLLLNLLNKTDSDFWQLVFQNFQNLYMSIRFSLARSDRYLIFLQTTRVQIPDLNFNFVAVSLRRFPVNIIK